VYIGGGKGCTKCRNFASNVTRNAMFLDWLKSENNKYIFVEDDRNGTKFVDDGVISGIKRVQSFGGNQYPYIGFIRFKEKDGSFVQ
jgi:hypothetical protein